VTWSPNKFGDLPPYLTYASWIFEKNVFPPFPEPHNDEDVEDEDEGERSRKSKYEGVECECGL
jgi:hypothetical protein